MGDAREWLEEYVGKVFLGWNLDKSNLPLCYPFPDVVMVNVDMLRAHVSFGVKAECNRGGIVTMKNSREFAFETDFGHEGKHPACLLRSMTECHVSHLPTVPLR